MDNHFDTEIAQTYDEDVAFKASAEDLAMTVQVLRELAGNGRALEFAIGTGRVAIPLAAAGVTVVGNEFSQAMVDQMRAKPGGADIPVGIGDMASLRSEGTFSLVYLVFNTINNLESLEAQMDCFANAARHLEPGGAFVVEVGVPQLQRLPEGERYVPFKISETHWGVDEYDVVSQTMISHHLYLEGDKARQVSVPFRYVWPSELDIMARAAGMVLRHRWADWDKSPFNERSKSHLSVWVKEG